MFMQQMLEAPQEQGNTVPVEYSRYLLDFDERIVEVDDAFERLTGYSRNEVVGRKSQYDLIPPEDRAYYIKLVNDQFMRGDLAYLKHEIERKDGERVWVICLGKRYFDSASRSFRAEILVRAIMPGE